MRTLGTLVGMILLVSLLFAKAVMPTAGEILYRQGILSSGSPVTGHRDSGESASGATAACINCHRPSGLGTVEGRIIIPPITAKYLFAQGLQVSPLPKNYQGAPPDTAGRSPYTDGTLARAIREGINSDGRQMNYLMPHYKLDDATMASLIAYLKQLSSGPVPGVVGDTLHFATIITPDADAIKRKGMLDVLEHFFAAENGFYRPIPPPVRSTRMMYRVPRKWQLHIWELVGDPETWREQLHKRLQSEPVFAVISGLGGQTWKPVHQFCQEESLPCLFPNTDLPIVSEGDFYDLYFSKAVLLEAQLIARRLRDSAGKMGMHRVIQVYREGDIGASAAKALHDAFASRDFKTLSRELKSGATEAELANAVKIDNDKDALVLWLRADDLRNLPPEPPKSTFIFVSGLMGGLEDSPIADAWRSVSKMTYPFELPSRRAVLLGYPLGWFRIQRINIVAEQTQVDTYIACGIVSENLRNMQDNFIRDYLIENIESMLSTRIVNGYYPRLGLAPGQRFASKGGYIVHFVGPDGKKLAAETDWIVP